MSGNKTLEAYEKQSPLDATLPPKLVLREHDITGRNTINVVKNNGVDEYHWQVKGRTATGVSYEFFGVTQSAAEARRLSIFYQQLVRVQR